MNISYDSVLDAIEKLFGVIKKIIEQVYSVIAVVDGFQGDSTSESTEADDQ